MKINSCLVFAFLVLLVSYALAIQTSTANHEAKETKNKVEPAYGGGGGNSGGGGGGNWGGGGGGNWGGGGGGGGCKHGCCYRGNYGCNRCCASPEEAKAYAEKQGGTEEAKDKVEPAYGGGGGNWGGGGGGSGGGGGRGGGGGSWGGGGGGGGCNHGCCYKGHYGCNRCCASPEEAKAYAEKQGTKGATDKVEPAYGGGGGNWGGGGGGSGGGGSGGGGGGSWGGGGGRGGCNHGCCYRGSYGCQRCCASAEEAKAYAEKQAKP